MFRSSMLGDDLTEAEYRIVAPYKIICSKGHVLDETTELRAKRHTPYGKYIARMCRVCAQAYQQARKRQLKAQKRPRQTRKGEKPPAAELADLIDKHTWTALGLRYGVSDVTVRKWALSYGLL